MASRFCWVFCRWWRVGSRIQSASKGWCGCGFRNNSTMSSRGMTSCLLFCCLLILALLALLRPSSTQYSFSPYAVTHLCLAQPCSSRNRMVSNLISCSSQGRELSWISVIAGWSCRGSCWFRITLIASCPCAERSRRRGLVFIRIISWLWWTTCIKGSFLRKCWPFSRISHLRSK